jgi:peptidoglycan/LPS O-acetylase OafA/YrhL
MHARQLGLDIFRSIAIIFVIIAHNHDVFEHTSTQNILSAMGYMGQWGVDFFFALSGFLIGRILIRSLAKYRNTEWIPNFIYRRWLKTLPLYYIVLFFYALIHGFPKDFFLYVFHIKGLISWTPPIFYGVSWSLFIEEFFYLLCAVCALIFYYKKTPISPLGLLKFCLLIIFIAVSFRMIFFTFYGNQSEILNITIARLDAPIFGFIIAVIKEYYPIIFHQLEKHRNILFIFGAMVILPTIVPNLGIISAITSYIILFAFSALIGGLLINFLYKKIPFNLRIFKYRNSTYKKIMRYAVYLLIAILLFSLSINGYLVYFRSTWSFSIASMASTLFLIYFATMPDINIGSRLSITIRFLSQSSYAVYLTHELLINFCLSFIKNTPEYFDLKYCIFISLLSIFLIYLLCYFLVTFIEKPILSWRDRKILL